MSPIDRITICPPRFADGYVLLQYAGGLEEVEQKDLFRLKWEKHFDGYNELLSFYKRQKVSRETNQELMIP